MLISESYRELNRKLHEDNPDYGAGIQTRIWYQQIDALAKMLKATSILDWGAGKGNLGKALSHLMVENYDPAIPEFSAEPDPCDLVVCLDVIEHIEPDCINACLDELKRLSKKGVFLTISTRLAGKTLADGRNAHLSVCPPEWWIPKLMARWEMRNFSARDDDFVFFGLALPQAQTRKEAA